MTIDLNFEHLSLRKHFENFTLVNLRKSVAFDTQNSDSLSWDIAVPQTPCYVPNPFQRVSKITTFTHFEFVSSFFRSRPIIFLPKFFVAPLLGAPRSSGAPVHRTTWTPVVLFHVINMHAACSLPVIFQSIILSFCIVAACNLVLHFPLFYFSVSCLTKCDRLSAIAVITRFININTVC